MLRWGGMFAAACCLTLYRADASARPDNQPTGKPRKLARAGHRRRPPPAKRYISSQAYLHALRAELATLKGDRQTAVDELQLALVYDPHSQHLALALARASLRVDKEKKAKKLVDRILKREPRHFEAWCLSGEIAAAAKRWPEAERAYRRAVSVRPADERALLGLAAALERRSKRKEAARVLKRGADRAPQSTALLVALAKLQKARGRLGRAAHALERARTRDPQDASLLVQLSDVYERQLRNADAAEAWRGFVDTYPQNPVALLEAARYALQTEQSGRAFLFLEQLESLGAEQADRSIGLMLLSEGENDRAVKKLGEVTRAKPGDTEARHAYAIALARTGEVNAALSELAHIGRDSPVYESARVHLASLLMEEGRLDRAELALRHALEAKPTSPEVLELLAQVLERRGRVDEAIVLLREVPGDVSLRTRLARVEASILLRQGRREEAEQLMSAVTIDGDRRARFALASFLWELGEHQRAIPMLQRLADKKPIDARVLNYLGYGLAELDRNLSDAETAIRRALARSPSDPAYLDSYGYVLARQGKLEEAEPFLRRAWRMAPRDPEIGEHLADVIAKRGNRKQARRVYREAMKLLDRQIRARAPDAKARRARLKKKLAELS